MRHQMWIDQKAGLLVRCFITLITMYPFDQTFIFAQKSDAPPAKGYEMSHSFLRPEPIIDADRTVALFRQRRSPHHEWRIGRHLGYQMYTMPSARPERT